MLLASKAKDFHLKSDKMNTLLKKTLRKPYYQFRDLIDRNRVDDGSLSQQIQRNIITQYLLVKQQGGRLYPKLCESGFRVYSEFEEDGMILYVLAMIGFRSKRVVEMCCGTGRECMATNLILNHGFDGYLFDGDPANIELAQTFFRSKKDCLLYSPVLRNAWITTDNVNNLLVESGCGGEVDVFSLDMDGNDYWIWQAIKAIKPRLLVCETHNIIPSDQSLTIEYQPDFECWSKSGHEQDYRSVSLLAMVNLCKEKGYRLIGAHRHGFNAFFLREDEGRNFFPEVSVEEVHDNYWTKSGQANRWPLVKRMNWVKV
jgi:hypothetical protein